jgi:hypothetical protein
MTEEHDRLQQDPAHPAGGEMSEDEIDSNLEDSFPASDPPSWTLGTNHKEAPESDPSPAAPTGESGQSGTSDG